MKQFWESNYKSMDHDQVMAEIARLAHLKYFDPEKTDKLACLALEASLKRGR